MKRKLSPARSTVRILCLAALTAGVAPLPAATKKKTTPAAAPATAPASPPAAAVAEPPPKQSWLKKLKGPFRKDAPAASAAPETFPQPAPAAGPGAPATKGARKAGNSKSQPAAAEVKPGTAAPSARGTTRAGRAKAKVEPSAPAIPSKSLADAKTRKPAPAPPSATAAPMPDSNGQAAPAAVKKPGFFARLKNKISGGAANDEENGKAADRETAENGHSGPPGRNGRGNPATAEEEGPEKPPRPADWEERFVITEDSTAFYAFGPSQAGGADERLSKGQVVKLTEAGRGWTRVELESGRVGYVGTDQVRKAQENDFSAPAIPRQLAAAGTQGLQPKAWAPAAPMPDLPDLPMAPGTENSLLLLPPLDGKGPMVRKSGGPPALEPPDLEAPTLKPGDAVDSLPPEGKENPSAAAADKKEETAKSPEAPAAPPVAPKPEEAKTEKDPGTAPASPEPAPAPVPENGTKDDPPAPENPASPAPPTEPAPSDPPAAPPQP